MAGLSRATPDVPERAMVFDCRGDRLIGVLAQAPGERGVLVVVGGPQYRVGSHRQFVQLARALARAGFPVLRFDYRGIGDSEGELRGFEFVAEDIAAALDAFHGAVEALDEVVLWGLCDAASAALLYAPTDPRVKGLVLLNPWVRSGQSEARAYLRHYYVRRLCSAEFWRRLLSGRLDVAASARSAATFVAVALGRRPGRQDPESGSAAAAGDAGGEGRAPPPTLPRLAERMARALAEFRGNVLLITSGDDLTAAEFLDVTRASRTWRRLLDSPRVVCRHLDAANHTFSDSRWKRQVEAWTREWLESW